MSENKGGIKKENKLTTLEHIKTSLLAVKYLIGQVLKGTTDAIDELNQELQDYALISETGFSLVLHVTESNEKEIQLRNKSGQVLSSQVLDFAQEAAFVNVKYNKETNELTFIMQNGTESDPIDISNIVRGLVSDDRTIADISLKNDITVDELKKALGIDELSEVAYSGKYDDLDGKLLPDDETIAKNEDGKLYVNSTVITGDEENPNKVWATNEEGEAGWRNNTGSVPMNTSEQDGIVQKGEDSPNSFWGTDEEGNPRWIEVEQNSKHGNGFVPKGEGNPNKIWGTDEEGNPRWQDPQELSTTIATDENPGYVKPDGDTIKLLDDQGTIGVDVDKIKDGLEIEVPINTRETDGIVPKGENNPNSVYGTDEDGNPSWLNEGKLEFEIDENGDLLQRGRILGKEVQVIDNLESDSRIDALSAIQGKILNDKFAGYSLATTPDGKIGYRKDGADTVYPFRSSGDDGGEWKQACYLTWISRDHQTSTKYLYKATPKVETIDNNIVSSLVNDKYAISGGYEIHFKKPVKCRVFLAFGRTGNGAEIAGGFSFYTTNMSSANSGKGSYSNSIVPNMLYKEEAGVKKISTYVRTSNTSYTGYGGLLVLYQDQE